MFVFGGYIDMRGASDELWQYELGECLCVTDKRFHGTENQSSIDTIPEMLLGYCALGPRLPEDNSKIFTYLLQPKEIRFALRAHLRLFGV